MADRQARSFEDKPAAREKSPLLIGLSAPSGGGKTYSALRLARGIQQVVGGEIFVVDTDNGRALHYADMFANEDGSPGFRHVRFDPPHSSLAYVDVIRFCVAKGAGVIVIDGMSHEHEGVGGMLDFHESEVDRMAGDNASAARREAVKMLAWSKPKAARRALILEIQRLMIPTIFCFRAKEGVKPVRVTQANGSVKTEVIQQGFTPIAGDEFVFEMTLNALLLPASGGVPTWNPENPGEKKMTKLPAQFEFLRSIEKPIDETLGVGLAKWAGTGVERPAGPRDDSQEQRARQETPREDGPRQAADMPRDGEEAASAPETGQGDGSNVLEAIRTGQEFRAEDDFPGDRKAATAKALEVLRTDQPVEDEKTATTRPATPDEIAAAKAEQAHKDDDAAKRQAAEAAAMRQGEEMRTGSETPKESNGFVDFADLLAEANDWPQIVLGLRELTASTAWNAAAYDVQMRARSAAYHRLRALNEGGYVLDFLNDPQAFRCYVEAEDHAGTLALNFGAFKAGNIWKSLPEPVRESFATAVGRRTATLTAAGSAPSDYA